MLRHEVPEGHCHSRIRSLARYHSRFHPGSCRSTAGPELRRQWRTCIARRRISDSALSLYQFARLCPFIGCVGRSSAFPQAQGSKTSRNSLNSRECCVTARDPSTACDLRALARRSHSAQDDRIVNYPCDPCQSVAKALLHKPAGIFLGGAADGQAIDLDGRNAHANGHGLSIFAAGADAFV
jgi:hypothetical protein